MLRNNFKGVSSMGLFSLLTLLCGTAHAADQSTKPATGNSEVFMAFSGGGYHAHAGASVMMMSLMDRLNDMNLQNVTNNVTSIASNSGGTWFVSQAAFSNTFLSMMQTPGASNSFATTGYLGQAYNYITHQSVCADWKYKLLCEATKDGLSLIVGKGFAGFLLSGRGEWDTVIHQSVFGENAKSPIFNMASELSSTNLGGARNDWAKDKALIFASSLLTESPALTSEKTEGIIQIGIRSLQGSQPNVAYKNTPFIPGAAPIMFADMGTSGLIQPDFLPGGDMSLQYGSWDKEKGFVAGPNTSELKNADINVSGLNVIHAAANSSAAGGGFIDIPMLLKSPEFKESPGTAVSLNGFAPAYSMANSVTYESNVRNNIGSDEKTLAENKVVRLADGGFVDNTAVSHLLRHMQDNGKLVDGFNIMAMDNFPAGRYVNNNNAFPTASDIAALFKNAQNTDTIQEVSLLGFKFVGILPSVFERQAYFDENGNPAKNADWEYTYDSEKGDCHYYFSYTKYDVTTRPNSFFGITSSGVKGNLHVFSVLSPNAAVVPTKQSEIDCYQNMLTKLNSLVTTKSDNNNKGLGEYLEEALGL